MPENRSGYVRWMLVAAAVVLSGCTNPFAGDAPTFDEILVAGWLEDKTPAVIVPLYCYDALGPAERGGNAFAWQRTVRGRCASDEYRSGFR